MYFFHPSEYGVIDCNNMAHLQVVMAYTVGIVLSLLTFQSVPGSLPWLQWFNVFMIGFFIYGPQVLKKIALKE